jgi:diguanylate cyclase (GGDEF)-like protein
MLGEVAYQKAGPFVLRALQGETVSFDGELTTSEGYRSYRSDYIPQFTADDHRVMGFVSIITDTTGQKLEERRLIALSQRDPLTGLLNRAGLDARLREALQHAQQSQSYLAVMYLDIDRFKQINDGLGHVVGDMLLQGFGGRLAKTLRASDTVARPGGDEFVILLEDIDSPSSAARMAKNIVDAMQDPFILEDKAIQVTTSIGVAIHQGSATATAKDLMRRADEQLYLAKGAGRNRYRMEEGAAI